MKLTKFHKVLKFKQSDWIKKYINFNTEKRMNPDNNFEKDFFKLMINSVHRKTMENLQKSINVRLVNKAEDFLRYTNKPTHITHKVFGKDYLDLSKWKMYDFHYNFIKNNFDAELLLTDTDSLTYEIKSKNVYEEFFQWKDLFDFSNFSNDSKLFDKNNKNVIGRMKDEFGRVIVGEFVGLKSKKYSIKKIMVKNIIQQNE